MLRHHVAPSIVSTPRPGVGPGARLEIEVTPCSPQARRTKWPPDRDGKLSGDGKPLGDMATEGQLASRSSIMNASRPPGTRRGPAHGRPGRTWQGGRPGHSGGSGNASSMQARPASGSLRLHARESVGAMVNGHQPPPPEPPELDDEYRCLARSLVPEGVTAHQRPPESMRRLPLTWPAAVSPM